MEGESQEAAGACPGPRDPQWEEKELNLANLPLAPAWCLRQQASAHITWNPQSHHQAGPRQRRPRAEAWRSQRVREQPRKVERPHCCPHWGPDQPAHSPACPWSLSAQPMSSSTKEGWRSPSGVHCTREGSGRHLMPSVFLCNLGNPPPMRSAS